MPYETLKLDHVKTPGKKVTGSVFHQLVAMTFKAGGGGGEQTLFPKG